jgi:hypothetical protein
MSTASGRSHPLRAVFVLSVFTATVLLLAYGWIEHRWVATGYYLAILLLTAVFLTPPIWSYTRVTKLDESPEADDAQEPEIDRF